MCRCKAERMGEYGLTLRVPGLNLVKQFYTAFVEIRFCRPTLAFVTTAAGLFRTIAGRVRRISQRRRSTVRIFEIRNQNRYANCLTSSSDTGPCACAVPDDIAFKLF